MAAPRAEPYVQLGEMWQLGRHRILCGDSTNAQDVAHLLDGAKPALTVTDQPFGVSFDPSQRAGAFRKGLVTNDDRADWREAWALSPSDVLYVWHSGIHAPEVGAGIGGVGLPDPLADRMVEARACDRAGGVSLAARAVLLRCPRGRQRRLDR